MRDHVTHHDDCGCQSAALTAHIATLEAELAGMRAQWEQWTALGKIAEQEGREIIGECHQWQAHANALRDALDNARAFIATAQSADAFHEWAVDTKNGGLDVHAALVRCNAALAQTPAASLASYRASALYEALAGLPAGYYAFRKKHDAADSKFDVAVLATEAVEALGDLGVTEAAFSMSFSECVEALEREVAK